MGSSSSIITHETVKDLQTLGLRNMKRGFETTWSTQAGVFNKDATIKLQQLTLPQFTTNRMFESTFQLLKREIRASFDAIIGKDIQQKIGLDVFSSKKQFQWDDVFIPKVPKGHYSSKNKRYRYNEAKQDKHVA